MIKPPAKQEPTGLSWEGQVPAQKRMNFYTKVLSKFAASKGLKLIVRFELFADGSDLAAEDREIEGVAAQAGG